MPVWLWSLHFVCAMREIKLKSERKTARTKLRKLRKRKNEKKKTKQNSLFEVHQLINAQRHMQLNVNKNQQHLKFQSCSAFESNLNWSSESNVTICSKNDLTVFAFKQDEKWATKQQHNKEIERCNMITLMGLLHFISFYADHFWAVCARARLFVCVCTCVVSFINICSSHWYLLISSVHLKMVK